MRRIVLFALVLSVLTVTAPSALAKEVLPRSTTVKKDYPGDAAPKVAIAQWMAYHAF